jgi:hypothetical protein
MIEKRKAEEAKKAKEGKKDEEAMKSEGNGPKEPTKLS